ncbi:MAG: AAA family ATPase [Solirubrobacteraceae bacterium]
MSEEPSVPVVSIVGRELELATLREAPVAESGVSGLVLVGEPGIGKTTLWEEGTMAARARGARVLSARPSEGEARLPFSGLIDLCEGLGSAELGALPSPQRHALEVALLRADPTDGSAHPGAVEFGFVTVIRGLAARTPVVIAIDDLHWLDGPSAAVLAFAARRLGQLRVDFLLARRPGRATEVERALERGSLVKLEVGAMTLGAVRRMLGERFGLTLPRPLLRRVVAVTQGNPLFALEIGRSLLEQEAPAGDHQVPLPDSVEEMLGGRISHLRAGARTALLATALSQDLRLEALTAVAGSDAVDDALAAGVLVVDDDRVRAAHPLLAAVARKQSRIRERRELHRLLANAVDEGPLRALHLALGSTGTNDQLAATLAAAAHEASARGGRLLATQLAGHALRMTSASSAARDDRVLALATCLYEAGELRRLTELLSEELESLSAGATRARARLLLAEGAGSRSLDELDGHLQAALAECGDDTGLRAYVLAKRAANTAAGRVAQLGEAEAWALEAVRGADQREVERFALYALAWARALTGRPVDELCERSRVDADAGAYLAASPERVAAQRLVWRAEFAPARTALGRLLELADERGEEASHGLMHMHLCELELRAGDWNRASMLLDEWAESWDGELTFRPQYERCRALLAAGRGTVDGAQRWAGKAIARAEGSGSRWDELEARRARGMAELRAGAPERATDDLGLVWKHTQTEGVLEPGAFPVAPELVEALVEVDELAEARTVTDQLARLAKRQEHPWGLASVKRCRALLRPRAEQRAAALAAAADELERLGLHFEAARTQLALGRIQRRGKQWRAAREALTNAEEAFDRIGSPGWAELASAERQRVGGRRPADSGELTPTEQRVVELAARGLANKQIASALFVTVHTVEVHLARAYAKLGVRSRAQLVARLAGQAPPAAADAEPRPKD